jgi:hypothetical protein
MLGTWQKLNLERERLHKMLRTWQISILKERLHEMLGTWQKLNPEREATWNA